MGGCLGGLVRFASASSVETLEIPQKRSIGQLSSSAKRQWSSSPQEMENSVGNSHSHETHQLIGSAVVNEETKMIEKNVNNCPFVNQAAIAWNERRRLWVGDQSQKSHKMPREPVISWSTTYDDLLTTSQPFPQPIPLPEMVDFLVDIWHEEGLYD
ncbi:uncharacterized protein LOC131231868 isoform X2 [Magnolia sinica]|uniref:uncharacterized protein LOC131231868 isoform X2 n=1 Tax=Magnolia sinica TaxID=86752 RepID=UPI00265A8C1F|nr:uncharacterized protein LOC131231868 isoform X2 [Magnolia sinica]